MPSQLYYKMTNPRVPVLRIKLVIETDTQAMTTATIYNRRSPMSKESLEWIMAELRKELERNVEEFALPEVEDV